MKQRDLRTDVHLVDRRTSTTAVVGTHVLLYTSNDSSTCECYCSYIQPVKVWNGELVNQLNSQQVNFQSNDGIVN